MSRFVPVIRETWLVAWRYRLNRDIRRKIVALVRSRLFDWESEFLRNERAEIAARHFDDAVAELYDETLWKVRDAVEKCSKLPFPSGVDATLRLQRVTVKRRRFSGVQREWLWLYP